MRLLRILVDLFAGRKCMNNSRAMFTSNSDEYSTPDALFESLNEEFDFTLDPCATHENHKCLTYYTSAENGLNQNWGGTCVLQSSV